MTEHGTASAQRAAARRHHPCGDQPRPLSSLIRPGFCYLCRTSVPDAMVVSVVVGAAGPDHVQTACLEHARQLARSRPWIAPDITAVEAAIADAARCLLSGTLLHDLNGLVAELVEALEACGRDTVRAATHPRLHTAWNSAPESDRARTLLTAAWLSRYATLHTPDDTSGQYARTLHKRAAQCSVDEGGIFRVGALLSPHPLPAPDTGLTAALQLLAAACEGPVAPLVTSYAPHPASADLAPCFTSG